MLILDNNGFVNKFIRELNLPRDAEKIALILFKTEDDCKEFYIKHLGRSKSSSTDIMNLRREKINLSDNDSMYTDKITVEYLEEIFLQPLGQVKGSFIIESINNGKTTLKELYKKFRINSDVNILRHLL